MECLEAAHGGVGTQHLPRWHVLGKALKGDRAKIAILEEAARHPPGARFNHYGARLGQRLEAGSKIRRLADDRLLLGRADADEVPDHDEPGGDADAHLQRNASGGLKPLHRLDEGEPSANSALRIMLVSLGIAEIGQYTVAHASGDEPAIALDQFGATAVVIGDDRSKVLQIEMNRDGSRAHKVAEHHSELSTLGAVIRGRRHRRRGLTRSLRRTAKLPDRSQDATAMT